MWRGLMLAGGLILGLMQVGPSVVDEFPVRWSPSLQLDSLDQIDERWKRLVLKDTPIWLERVEGWPREKEITLRTTADNCSRYYALHEQQYWASYVSEQRDKIATNSAVLCFVLHLLRRARPASESYVGELRFDEAAIDLLPPDVAEVGESAIRFVVYYSWPRPDPLSWREAWDKTEGGKYTPVVTTRSDMSALYAWGDDKTLLSWVASGDFDGDRLEDVLVTARTDTFGTFGELRLLLLTRRQDERLIRISEEFTEQMRKNVLPPLKDDWEIPWLVAAAPSALIPIRWSPTLKLQSLDAVDAALAAPLYDDDYGYPVSREYVFDEESQSYEPVDDAEIKTCLDYFSLIPRGYGGHYRDDFEKIAGIGRDCELLKTMKRARPSRVTHLEQFRLNRRTPYIMPMVDICPGSESGHRESISRALRGEPWLGSKSSTFPRVVYDDPFSTTYHHEYEWAIDVELLARADFNGDGIEDLLVSLGCSRTRELSNNSSGSMLLTKLSETAPITLLAVPDDDQ